MEICLMLLTTLIKKNEQLKLDLFKQLTERQQLSINDLMSATGMTKSSLYYAVKQLIDDLKSFDLPVQITYENKEYTTIFKKEYMTALAAQSQLLDQYIQMSSSFQLLTSFLTDRQISLIDLADLLQISTSHVYKIIHTANDFLTSFDLQLVIDHKLIQLIGPEQALAAFRFFLQAFLSVDTHSSLKSQKIDPKLFPKNYHLDILAASDKQALVALLEVLDQSDLNAALMNQQLQHSGALTFMELLDAEQPNELVLWKAFLIRVFFPQVISEEEMIIYGQKIQQQTTFPAAKIATEILAYVIEIFGLHNIPLDSENYHLYLYILTLHLLYIDFFGKDIKQTFYHQRLQESIPDYESTLYQTLETYYEKFQPTTASWPNKNQCKQVILETLYLLTSTPKKPTLKIYIDFLGNIIAEIAFKQKIEQLFDDTIFSFTNDESVADVLITNHITRVQSKTLKTFHIQNLADKSAWEHIFTEIFQLVYQKSLHDNSQH